jgi:hypothetical protein
MRRGYVNLAVPRGTYADVVEHHHSAVEVDLEPVRLLRQKREIECASGAVERVHDRFPGDVAVRDRAGEKHRKPGRALQLPQRQRVLVGAAHLVGDGRPFELHVIVRDRVSLPEREAAVARECNLALRDRTWHEVGHDRNDAVDAGIPEPLLPYDRPACKVAVVDVDDVRADGRSIQSRGSPTSATCARRSRFGRAPTRRSSPSRAVAGDADRDQLGRGANTKTRSRSAPRIATTVAGFHPSGSSSDRDAERSRAARPA